MKERWKPVVGAARYSVSDMGRVMGPGRKGQGPSIITPVLRSEYLRISIGRKNFSIHKMVLEAFLGPAPTGKDRCAHWNGNKSDNRLVNLRWASAKENSDDGLRLGEWRGAKTFFVGEKHPAAKLSHKHTKEIIELYKSGKFSQAAISKKFGVSQSLISMITLGKIWKNV